MTYISDINTATPSGDDLLLNGDDQIRALKADLKNTLGGLNGPVKQDADTSGAGGSTLVTAATMSSWEARIKALEQGGGGGTAPATGSIPVGGIMVWYGDAGTIPTGWKQCNGASYRYTPVGGGSATIQTPDLRGRAVIGPGATNGPVWNQSSSFNWSASGFGPAIFNVSDSQGAHTHTTSTPGQALTTAQMPSHFHAILDDADAGSDVTNLFQSVSRTGSTYTMRAGDAAATLGATGTSGSGATHTHPNATSGSSGAHTHQVQTAPPYLGLYHIMYVADGVPA